MQQLHRSRNQPKQAPLAQAPRRLLSVHLRMTAPAGKLNRMLDRGTEGRAGTPSAQHKPVMPSWLMSAPCKLGESARQQAVQCDSALSGMIQLAELPGSPFGVQALLMAVPNRTQSLQACSSCESWHAGSLLRLTSRTDGMHVHTCPCIMQHRVSATRTALWKRSISPPIAVTEPNSTGLVSQA